MKTSENKKHSEDYFGEPRNFWWNQDYLELIAKRTGLNQCHKMLDVGCGVGYWSRLLAPFLCEDATMTGIDQEVSWVKKCAETQFARPAHFQVGDAQNLSFANESFDLVTCQTVLMHLKDPKAALTEFHRVLKPGGVLLIAEPNTSGAAAVRSNIDRTLSIQEQLLISELDMTCNR